MKDLEHASSMLKMARDDHTAMTGMLDTTLFTDAIFGFHTQQAVEKSLKAWLSALGLSYPPIHVIGRLLAQLESVTDVTPFWHWGTFTPFAVQYLYGMVDGDELPLSRVELIEQVSELLKKVADQIQQTND